MKLFRKALVIVRMIASYFDAYSQENPSVFELVKQGIELNSQKKYAEATEKYKAALATEPENVQANYQMAFTLFSAGRNAEALPFIDKATKGTNPKFTAAAYSLMGSIYQGIGQLPNAVTAYQDAIKADSTNQRIYYNLGIAYFKGKLYTESEASFEAAVKKDSSDAGSWRMYALATFHQNKRAQALLGFCSFLILEPNSAKSAEAFGNLQNILRQGALQPEPGFKPPSINKIMAEYQKQMIGLALEGMPKRRFNNQGDLLTAQLKAVFDGLNQISAQKQYLWLNLTDYFGKLASTDNVPAFARYISQSAKPESAKWLKDNAEKANALKAWLSANKLKFK
nr:tetratricopeptide repeat protein [uncultured Mucilaginibacter sp.]